jgi:hypothetical protein
MHHEGRLPGCVRQPSAFFNGDEDDQELGTTSRYRHAAVVFIQRCTLCFYLSGHFLAYITNVPRLVFVACNLFCPSHLQPVRSDARLCRGIWRTGGAAASSGCFSPQPAVRSRSIAPHISAMRCLLIRAEIPPYRTIRTI